jgi:hypothetical protein
VPRRGVAAIDVELADKCLLSNGRGVGNGSTSSQQIARDVTNDVVTRSPGAHSRHHAREEARYESPQWGLLQQRALGALAK